MDIAQPGYKQLFNSGVRYENHCYLSGPNKGKLIRGEFEEWHNGQLHHAFYLEEEPPKNSRRDWLQDAPLNNLRPDQVAIKIIGGNMISQYAVFTVLKEDDNAIAKN